MTRPVPTRSEAAPIERLSANDLTLLATDRGPAPMNIAALLRIDGGAQVPFGQVRATLGERLGRVPRLRQRLARSIRGRRWFGRRGRPVWVPHEAFSIEEHADARTGITSEEALLTMTAELACRRLPRDRPLWRATWVTGLPDGSAALVLVVHHVVTDGIGGLAVLRALADGPDRAATERSPGADRAGPAAPSGAGPARPAPIGQHPIRRPGAVELLLRPAGGVRRVGRGVTQTVRGVRELGLMSGSLRFAERTAYNRPTGPRRNLTTVTAPLRSVVDSAHAHGCTVNDIVVAAIVGAMAASLAEHGRRPERLVVSVPISSRQADSAGGLGNATGVVPIAVPTGADPLDRVRWVASTMRTHRSRATSEPTGSGPGDGPSRSRLRGASAGPMGAAFRALARAGLFQAFIDRQRLVNTFVTNVRGPAEPLFCLGHRVRSIVPVAVTPGNVGVTFGVLSYAGQLVVSVLGDPDVVSDQAALTRRLDEEFRAVVGAVPAQGR